MHLTIHPFIYQFVILDLGHYPHPSKYHNLGVILDLGHYPHPSKYHNLG
jgi:hypothetical protein